MKHNNTLSIPQVAKQLKKTRNTVYRYITTNKLKHEYSIVSGKKVIRVKESDLLKFCHKYNVSRYNDIDTDHDITDNITDTKPDTSEDIKQAINNAFLMYQKPLEEQALFVAGKLSTENQFLRAKVETLLQELDQYKSLPGPADIEKIQKENQEKEKDLIIQIEMERKEKADLKSIGEAIQREQEEKHRRELSELETRQEEQNELHRQELKQAWKQTEEEGKNYLATIEELKKRLEAEEKKPWYRKLFS